MAEELSTLPNTATKEEKYKILLPQLSELIRGEKDLVANLANIAAALKQSFDFLWVGFYMVKENELVLGPFQGPIACTRIAFGKGVCGAAWKEQKIIVVEDVEQFPGHIACSSSSKSEIVVPVIKNGIVLMVLDVDSSQLAAFDSVDEIYLDKICQLVEGLYR